MRVRMLKSLPGSPDGLRVYAYQAGQEYDEASNPPMSEGLATNFLGQGAAARVNAKGMGAAPENKRMPAPAENKVTRPDYDELSIAEVHEAIEAGRLSREDALRFERQGRQRVTLLRDLEG